MSPTVAVTGDVRATAGSGETGGDRNKNVNSPLNVIKIGPCLCSFQIPFKLSMPLLESISLYYNILQIHYETHMYILVLHTKPLNV